MMVFIEGFLNYIFTFGICFFVGGVPGMAVELVDAFVPFVSSSCFIAFFSFNICPFGVSISFLRDKTAEPLDFFFFFGLANPGTLISFSSLRGTTLGGMM